MKKTVSLVLGSGGARGLAHIGIIHWLEEHDYQIRSVSASSMGALIGGIYAMDRLDEFEHWVRAVRSFDIISLLDVSWSTSGLFKGDKVINTLVELVGDQLIEELPISYTAVAADIQNEKEVWIKSGRLFDAIRASISLPMFFTPHVRNGVSLIDGGVLNPVPIAPTFVDSTDMTIAVNLGGPVQAEHKPTESTPAETNNSEKFHQKIAAYISSLQKNAHPKRPNRDVFEISNQAFDAMQSTIARQKLAAYPPDYTIEIARNACRTLDFDRAAEMIELGYNRAAEVMTGITPK